MDGPEPTAGVALTHARKLMLLLGVAGACGLPTPAGATNTITTFAGSGAAASTGDGGPAANAALNWPYAMEWIADGAMLVAEVQGNRVRRIAPDGTITTVVGTGSGASTGDGGPATAATVNAPQGLAVAPDGVTYYIAERSGSRVRKVDASGTITTVVGALGAGFGGDGGPAGSAKVAGPEGLSVTPNGDLYIADRNNHRIRRVVHDAGGTVSAASTITTVAGNGTQSFSGDGGPATAAAFNQPLGIVASADGSFVISDFNNRRIRRVASDGTVTTIAGTGAACGALALCGDGGLATGATLSFPAGIASDGAGGYVFADYSAFRVRRIDSGGIITTVIGTGDTCGTTSRCGDGARAELASTAEPTGVLIGPGGEIYMSGFGHRIRVRTPNPNNAPAGPQGVDGGQGAAGAAGTDGVQGGTGTAGADGAAGARGPDGQDGAGGSRGRAGASGAAGAPGASGAAGPKGDAGERGRLAELLPQMVMLPSDAIESRPARRTWIRLFVGGGSTVRVSLSGGGLRRQVTRTFKRVGRKRFDMGQVGPGRYRVRAEILPTPGTVAAGSAVTDSTELVVRR